RLLRSARPLPRERPEREAVDVRGGGARSRTQHLRLRHGAPPVRRAYRAAVRAPATARFGLAEHPMLEPRAAVDGENITSDVGGEVGDEVGAGVRDLLFSAEPAERDPT